MWKIPLQHDSKKPLPGPDWHGRASADLKEHEKWRKKGLNVGLLLEENNLVCADFDILDAARAFFRKYMHDNIFNIVILSRKGAHFYWQGQTKTQKLVIDGETVGDEKGNGYMVDEGSTVNGFTYHAIPGYEWGNDLLPFPAHLPEFQDTRNEVQKVLTRGKVESLDGYLAKIESLQDGRGSAGLIRAAAVCRDAGLSEAECLEKLIWWNGLPVVRPPWPLHELTRAAKNVYRKQKV